MNTVMLNLIPKVNGSVTVHKGKLTVHEPLGYSGDLADEALAMRFGLLPAQEGVLALFQDASLPEEGYRLIISPEGIELRSGTKAGQLYGLITLQNLLRQFRGGLLGLDSKIPYMEIEDAPVHSQRGFLLDETSCRIGVTEIERLLEQMALLKLNTFRWRLPKNRNISAEFVD